MDPAKPSLGLLSSLTDEHVLRALMEQRRLTRAGLATRTGISKPTVSESVRRLTGAGLLYDTGERTTGRGRAGSYYALNEDLGSALVVSIAPTGVVAETIDVHGDVTSRAMEKFKGSAGSARVRRALRRAADRAQSTISAPARLAVVSAADPVDRSSGKLVHLPDAPFLVGELDPVDLLSANVNGAVTVDNDVNWAARAERDLTGEDERLDDFAYLHLGEGLGCAIVSDGDVRRGHGGLAGEIAHVLTQGPSGRAMHLTEVFAQLKLRHDGSTAIDTSTLLRAVDGTSARAARIRSTLAEAVCGVLGAIVALADPERIVIGGTWGSNPTILDAVTARFELQPRHAPTQPAQVAGDASLVAARHHACQELRNNILSRPVERR